MSTPLSTESPFRSSLAVRSEPYDPEPNRERIRATVAILFSVIFAIVIGVYAWGAYHLSDDKQWTRFKEALDVILPAVTTAFGSVLGFYFGSQRR